MGQISKHDLDFLMFDPFLGVKEAPETNKVLQSQGLRLRRLASATNALVGLVYRTRKLSTNGTTVTFDDSRGGNALRGNRHGRSGSLDDLLPKDSNWGRDLWLGRNEVGANQVDSWRRLANLLSAPSASQPAKPCCLRKPLRISVGT